MTDPDNYLRGFERRRKIIIGVIVAALSAPIVFLFVQCGQCMWGCQRATREAREEREEHSRTASPEQVAAVDAATAAFEASLEARAATWRAAMAGAASLVPRPDLGPCPVRLPLRQPYDASRGGSFGNLDSFSAIVMPGRQGFPHAIARGGQLPAEPPRVRLAREQAARLRERIRSEGSLEDLAGTVQQARELDRSWTYDVVVFATVDRPPVADALGRTFTPGRVEGVAVLFDYSSGTTACAGEVVAENGSRSVDYSAQMLHEATTLQSMLRAELDAELERAIAQAVRWRAGERPAAPDGGTPSSGSAPAD